MAPAGFPEQARPSRPARWEHPAAGARLAGSQAAGHQRPAGLPAPVHPERESARRKAAATGLRPAANGAASRQPGAAAFQAAESAPHLEAELEAEAEQPRAAKAASAVMVPQRAAAEQAEPPDAEARAPRAAEPADAPEAQRPGAAAVSDAAEEPQAALRAAAAVRGAVAPHAGAAGEVAEARAAAPLPGEAAGEQDEAEPPRVAAELQAVPGGAVQRPAAGHPAAAAGLAVDPAAVAWADRPGRPRRRGRLDPAP